MADPLPSPQPSPQPSPPPQAPQPSPPPQARTFRAVAPPPPPSVPKPPPRQRPIVRREATPAPGPEAPPSRWRELSADPDERKRQRASVSGECDALLAMADGLAQAFPPKAPLRDYERAMLETPLQETIYKYGGNVDPAVSLAIAAGAIVFMRWQEAEKAKKDGPRA